MCATGESCFNMPGTYKCIQTGCPRNYLQKTSRLAWLSSALNHILLSFSRMFARLLTFAIKSTNVTNNRRAFTRILIVTSLLLCASLKTQRSYAYQCDHYQSVVVLPINVTIPNDSYTWNFRELVTPLTLGECLVVSDT